MHVYMCRWYGAGPIKVVFVERKTHRDSWKGEESVKERFCLPENKVVPFLDGDYTIEDAVADLRAKVLFFCLQWFLRVFWGCCRPWLYGRHRTVSILANVVAKQCVCLPEKKVVPFLDGDYTIEDAVADLCAKVPPPP